MLKQSLSVCTDANRDQERSAWIKNGVFSVLLKIFVESGHHQIPDLFAITVEVCHSHDFVRSRFLFPSSLSWPPLVDSLLSYRSFFLDPGSSGRQSTRRSGTSPFFPSTPLYYFLLSTTALSSAPRIVWIVDLVIIGERENISVFVDTARDRNLWTVLDTGRIIGTAGFDPRLLVGQHGTAYQEPLGEAHHPDGSDV